MIDGASPSGAIGVAFAVVRRVRVAGFFAAGFPVTASPLPAGAEPASDVVDDAAGGFGEPDFDAGAFDEDEAAAAVPLARVAFGAAAGFGSASAPDPPAALPPAGGFVLRVRDDERAAPAPPDVRDAGRAAGVASVDSPSVGRSSSDGGSAVLIRLLPKG
jgi:hypothetical protein